jgi:hypothetical protein
MKIFSSDDQDKYFLAVRSRGNRHRSRQLIRHKC